MFKEEEMKILKNFKNISPKMKIINDKFAITNGTSHSSLALYNFENPYPFETDIPIYDLNKFFSIIDAMKKPLFKVNDKSIDIEDEDTNTKVKFNLAQSEFIVDVPLNVIEKLMSRKPEVEFTLPEDRGAIIDRLKKVLNADRMFFSRMGNGIKITLGQKNYNEIVDPLEIEINEQFIDVNNFPEDGTVLFLELDNWHLMTNTEYSMKLHYIAEKEKGAILCKNKNNASMYIISLDKYIID